MQIPTWQVRQHMCLSFGKLVLHLLHQVILSNDTYALKILPDPRVIKAALTNYQISLTQNQLLEQSVKMVATFLD